MIRIVTLLLLAAVVIAVGTVVVAVWSTGKDSPSGKLSGVQKISYVCLLAVMGGVSLGWLGAE